MPATERVEKAYKESELSIRCKPHQAVSEATAWDSRIITSFPLLPRMRLMEGGKEFALFVELAAEKCVLDASFH